MMSPPFREATTTGGIGSRLIATLRLVLSTAVLFIIGPADLDPSVRAFHIISALYIAYSVLLYTFAGRQVKPLFVKLTYWVDIGWIALLVTVSDDTIIAFLFLFPILVTAFQRGFTAALRLTLVAAQLLFAISFAKDIGEAPHLLEIFPPPIYLLVLGYLGASWGEREIAAKRRLVLLKELTKLSNPRFGIDRTIGTMVERLRVFYDADACLLIVTDRASDEYLLRRADRWGSERAIEAELIPVE